MRVYLTSRVTPAIKIYDTEDTSKGITEKIMRPEVFVTDDQGNVVWQTGQPTSENLFPVIVTGLFLILLWRFK